MADGEIIIDSHINTDTIEVDADKLVNKTKKIANNISDATNNMFNNVDTNKFINSISSLSPELKKLEIEIFNTANKIDYFKQNLGKYVKDGQLDVVMQQINSLSDNLTKLKFQKELLENVPIVSQSDVNNTNQQVVATEKVAQNIEKIDSETKKVTVSVSKMSNAFAMKLANSARNAAEAIVGAFRNSVSKIKSSLGTIESLFQRIFNRARWILLGQNIRKMFNEIRQSFDDLQTYSPKFAQTAQSIIDAFKRATNAIIAAFAPIVTALAPIINAISNAITNLMNKVAMFTSALFTGSTTATIANANFTGYSKTVAKTTKNTRKATKAAKEQYKTLAKFDKLDVFKRDKKQTAPAATTTPEMPRPQALDMFKEVAIPNNILQFANKVREAFAPLANEFKVIGQSFMDNFATPVINHIRENTLPRFLESTKNKLNEINFQPLNSALERLFKATSKFTIKIFNGLSWAWENIFLPMAGWTAEKLLPAFVEALASAVDLLNAAITAAKPLLKDFWEFIKKLGNWAGDKIIQALKTIRERFDDLTKWIEDNPEKFRNFIEEVERWVGAWFGAKGLITALGLIKSGIEAIPAALAWLKAVFIGVNTTMLFTVAIIYQIIKTIQELKRELGQRVEAYRRFQDMSEDQLNREANRSVLEGKDFYERQAIYAQKRIAEEILKRRRQGIQIPRLASGTVVSPNKQFLAMLGDNAYEPEVVSPISTMKRAFSEAINESNIQGGTGNITLEIDGKTFARLINPYMDSEKNRVGISMVQGVY